MDQVMYDLGLYSCHYSKRDVTRTGLIPMPIVTSYSYKGQQILMSSISSPDWSKSANRPKWINRENHNQNQN